MHIRKLACAALLGLAAGGAQAAATVLYAQDFEQPTGFVDDGGDVNIFRSVNQLYGDQPPGFLFTQTNTVETLLVGGTQAWGTGFLDPQKSAGNYTLGLLSSSQDDWLALSFDIGDYAFLNFQLDVSSIDLDRWGGPFVPAGGQTPTYRISLFDNPGGAAGLGAGTPLSFADISGTSNPLKNTFDWTRQVVGLSTAGNTDGHVILRIDLLTGGYAAMDNFVIAASDIAGEVPEPSAFGSMLAGLAALAALAAWRARR